MPRPKGSKNKKGRLGLKKFVCPACKKEFLGWRGHKRIHCSFRCKGITQSEKYKGKGNPFYGKSFRHTEFVKKWKIGKGGITPKIKLLRKSREYEIWRKAVFARDNWICQLCGIKGGTLHAHHIKLFAKNKDLRFSIYNGITLCKKCHQRVHNKIFYDRKLKKKNELFRSNLSKIS